MQFVRASTRSNPRCSPHLKSGLLAALFGVVVLLAVATLASVSPSQLGAALFSGDMRWVLLSAALYATGNCISALVWRDGLRGAGLGALPFGAIMRVHWVCRGVSELLPAQLGEIVRVAGFRGREETQGKTARLVGSVGVYKLIDGGTSVVIAIVVLAFIAPSLLPGALTGSLMFGVVGCALLLAGVAVLMRHRFTGLLPSAMRAAVLELGAGMRLLVSARRCGSALALQSAVIVFRIAGLAALLVAYGAPASAALLLFSVMVVASLIPISPGGVGVREAFVLPALVLVYGMGLETALVVSIATQALAFAVSIAGAGIALLIGASLRDTSQPAPAPAPPPVPVPVAA